MNLSDIIEAIDDADPTPGCAVWAIAFLTVGLTFVAFMVTIKLIIWSISWGLS